VERPKVEAELSAIASSLAHDYPAADEGLRMGTVPLARDLMGDARTIVLVLWAAVAFLLAVGCANVANLLLTHAVARRREFALRLSLGAGGSRLIRQLLTESLALAAVGGILGLALAYWALPQTLALLPRNFPRVRELRLDSTVLWFTFGVSIVTGLLFGLAPALGLVRRDLAQSLREGGAGAGRGVSHRRLGRVLAAGEVALVLVLTIGAGLVLRSLWRLSAVDPGFPARGVAAWQLFLPSARYPDGASQRAFYRNVLEQVRALPGVESAGLGGPLPFGPVNLIEDGGFRIEGRTEPSADRMPQALFTRASAGYFAALGIPVKRGRVFDTRDHESAAPAAVISETLAQRYFAGQDPVGRRLLLGRGRLPAEIVGVVGDVKHNSLRSVTRPELYLPLPRFPQASAGLVVRTSGDPAALLPSIQRRVWSVDSSIPANLAAPVERLLYASMAPARIAGVMLAAFAAATLALGLIGIYGVLSYSVGQRSREIGIRLALGASPGAVLWMVLREALVLSCAGAAVGLAAAFALSRLMSTMLFGVPPHDPATYILAAVAAPCAALAAAWAPARRAMRVDPAASLRAD
jgi:predicted permease